MPFNDFQHALEHIENINTRLTAQEQQSRKNLIQHFINAYPTPLNYNKQYDELLTKHIFTLDKQQHINHLYPFSALPTNKQILLKNYKTPIFAMCAIDAIGIHFTLHQDMIIKSQCELTKTPITITVANGQATTSVETPNICILHTDLSDISDWANNCCNQMHFFIDEIALNQWVQQYGCAHQIYYSLSLKQATIIAKKLFYTK